MSFETQNRAARPSSGSSSRRLYATATLFVLGTALLAGGQPAKAANEGYTVSPDGKTIEIWGTGRNSTNTAAETLSGTVKQEQNWKLIAFPDGNLNTGYKIVPAGKLYIPVTVPNGWAGQGSGSNTAVSGFRWITYANWTNPSDYGTYVSDATSYFNPTTLNATAVIPFTTGAGGQITNYTDGICGPPTPCTPPPSPPPNYYSYIAQTSFTPTVSGFYTFNTNIVADNFIEVYLGGSVTGADTVRPGIAGGTQLLQLADGNGPGLFKAVQTKTNANVYLVANNSYDLNYVIRDNATTASSVPSFGQTGFLVGATAFTYDVPAPLPVLGAAAFFHQARRLRRRVQAGCRVR